MTAALTLSKSEVRELTRTPIRRRQVAFCVRNGIRHYIDNDGWPVVLRSAVESTTEPAGGKPAWKRVLGLDPIASAFIASLNYINH